MRIEMARNAIESYLRTSKMAAGSHFVKNFKKYIKFRMDLKWPEMPSKVIFRHPKWPPEKKILYRSEMARIAIESEFQKSKMADRSEMARNALESEFWTSKMADVSHFVKNFKKKY